MHLITVLIALGVEFRWSSFDRYRNRSWFVRYSDWLAARLADVGPCNGRCSLLLTLFIPLAPLGVLVWLATEAHFLLGFLLSFVVLFYSLGPSLGALTDSYVAALEREDEAAGEEIRTRILYRATDADDEARLLAAIMLRAHERLFAVIFWFLLLGAVGALLYCLTLNLAQRHEQDDSDYAAAVKDLDNILTWPSARLLALGFALGGSLVSALDSWRTVSGPSLDASREVITLAGFGALHYEPATGAGSNAGQEDRVNRIRDTMGLVNRTLVVWLTVLGLMTITGWIS